MPELTALRKLSSKTFDNGNGSKTLEAHVGHIHYENKLLLGDGVGGLRALDWTLAWDASRRGWGFEYHSFHPFLPEYADEWVSFRDLFEGKDQMVRYRAVCAHVLGRLVPSIDGLTDWNAVIYDDAFGAGIDYILYFTRSALVKAIRIREDTKVEEDQQFAFAVEFPHEVKRTDGETEYVLDLTTDKTFDTDKTTLTGIDQDDGREWFTYLRPFKMWDSGRSERVPVAYKTDGVTGWLVKTIPLTFIESATGDVFTDTTTSYYATSGDGWVRRDQEPTWTAARDTADGDSFDYAYNGGTTYTRSHQESNAYNVSRGFTAHDSSDIPDTDDISAGSFNFKCSGRTDGGGSLCMVVGSQASTTALAITDFDNHGSVEFTTRRAISGLSADTWEVLTFNASGLAGINKTGYTKLVGRTSRDVDDSEPGDEVTDWVGFYTSETADDAYLSVTYAPGVIQKALSVATSVVVSISRDTSKGLSISTTVVPTISKVIATSFSASASAVASVVRKMLRPLAAIASAVASISTSRFFAKALSVTASAVVSIDRVTSRGLAVSATVVPTITKLTATSFAVSAAAVASVVKKALKPLAATGTGTTNVSRVTKKALSILASIVPTISSYKIGEVIQKTLSVTTSVVVSISRGTSKLLSISATAVPTLAHRTRISLSVAASAVASASRMTRKSLVATASAVVSVGRKTLKFLAVLASVIPTISAHKIGEVIQKALSVTASTVVSLSRKTSKALSATGTGVATRGATAIKKGLSVTTSSVVSIGKFIRKGLSVAALAVANLVITTEGFFPKVIVSRTRQFISITEERTRT